MSQGVQPCSRCSRKAPLSACTRNSRLLHSYFKTLTCTVVTPAVTPAASLM